MNFLGNITIRSRLIFVIAFLSFLLIAGGLIGIISLGFANDSLKTDYENRLVPMSHLDKIIRLTGSSQLAVTLALTEEPAAVAQAVDLVEGRIADIDHVWGEFSAVAQSSEEKKLSGDFVAARQKMIDEGLKPAMAALRANDMTEAGRLVRGPLPVLAAAVQEAVNALNRLKMDTAKKEFESSQFIYTMVRNSCITGIVFGIIFSAVIGIWMIRSISLPLEMAVRTARNVAAGNLTNLIETVSRDETGQLMQALKEMTDSLVIIVGKVRSGTVTIAGASNEIASGNLDLSRRTEQQANSLQETASFMEELTATVKQNADNAQTANQLARSASEFAVKGGVVVEQVVHTMTSINSSSEKIVDIIGVIDTIAFQTNILALNAAVEAARAGEQGRGFAVVATEVRHLAQRSAAAAREIKNLIDDSVAKVHDGAKLVDQAGSTMQEIVASVKRVTDIMGEITTASKEQAQGIEQVNQAISQMDEGTQRNAVLVEEASASAESLKDEAFELAEVVSVFKISAADQVPGAGLKVLPGPDAAARNGTLLT